MTSSTRHVLRVVVDGDFQFICIDIMNWIITYQGNNNYHNKDKTTKMEQSWITKFLKRKNKVLCIAWASVI